MPIIENNGDAWYAKFVQILSISFERPMVIVTRSIDLTLPDLQICLMPSLPVVLY